MICTRPAGVIMVCMIDGRTMIHEARDHQTMITPDMINDHQAMITRTMIKSMITRTMITKVVITRTMIDDHHRRSPMIILDHDQ